MYQAKRKGGASHQIIDLREARQTDDRNSLERDLHGAFGRGQLAVAYQPIVRSRDGLITGVEALLRWTHPTHGPVPPAVMVEIAEQIEPHLSTSASGCWSAAAATAAALARGTIPTRPLDLAVNLSIRQLMSTDFCSVVTRRARPRPAWIRRTWCWR